MGKSKTGLPDVLVVYEIMKPGEGLTSQVVILPVREHSGR